MKENIPLAQYTTFKIGGKARYFLIARNKKDLIEGIEKAKELDVPFFILGKGSKVLFSDKGFDGLVIKCQMSDAWSNGNEIYAEVGAGLDFLAATSQENSLAGLEWAAGIPGTIGGAVCGNAQAFGTKTSDIVKSVEVLDTETLEFKNFSKKECGFGIKKSIFKKDKNLVIVSVILELKRGDEKDIKKKTKEYLAFREKGHPMNFPSAGSVFINKEVNPDLIERFPELKQFKEIPSAYLVEKCGLKGKTIGNAKISEKHANFIINLGGAKSEDVLALIKLAQKKVKEKFNIELETEIRII